jgi:hypothetical protein
MPSCARLIETERVVASSGLLERVDRLGLRCSSTSLGFVGGRLVIVLVDLHLACTKLASLVRLLNRLVLLKVCQAEIICRRFRLLGLNDLRRCSTTSVTVSAASVRLLFASILR